MITIPKDPENTDPSQGLIHGPSPLGVVQPEPIFSTAPLLYILLAVILGILVSNIHSFPLYLSLLISLASGFASLRMLRMLQILRRRDNFLTIFWLLLGFVFFGIGLGSFDYKSNAVNKLLFERLSGETVELSGHIGAAIESSPDGQYMLLDLEQIKSDQQEQIISGKVSLFLPLRSAEEEIAFERLGLQYSARVTVGAKISSVERYRNPGMRSFGEYLERRNLSATGIIKSPTRINILERASRFNPLVWIFKWRTQLIRHLNKEFEPQTAAVLTASLIGNRHYLTRQTAERFRAGGTFHLLVISGGHITLIGIMAIAIARRLTKQSLWQIIAAATLLFIYTIAVGAESSVVRAAIMFSFAALAPLFFRRANRFNTLAVGCLILLIWKPNNLFDPSFLLTFLSVLALIAIAWPISTRLKAIGEWRPSTVTPYPPRVRSLVRVPAEVLFWCERSWRREMENHNYSYGLYKTRVARLVDLVRLQKPLRYLSVALIATLSVQIILMPIEVSYFHRISISGLFLNLFVGILLASVSITAFLALLIGQVWIQGATPFIWLAEKFNWLMIHSIDPFSHLGIDVVRLPAYRGWRAKTLYFFFYLMILLLMIMLEHWNPFKLENTSEHQEESGQQKKIVKLLNWRPHKIALAATITLLLAISIIINHPMIAPRADGRLHIDFLDVGQGDAALVTMPDGTTLLIDGGGRPDFARRLREEAGESDLSFDEVYERDSPSVGETVVSEFLWWKGLDHVDYILATHADTDHIDGLTFVARDFKVKAAFVGRTPHSDEDFKRFAAMLYQRSVPLFVLGRGDKFRVTTGQGEVLGEFLWPLDPSAHSNQMIKNVNDESLILRLRFGERSFLFTGDAGRSVEDWLMTNQENFRSDVIKVAHHGSRTASGERFVSAVSPQTAIVSVGLSSPYHHPHAEVIKRWRDSGAEVLTTGQRGTISISTDGHDLILKTFVP